MPTYSSGSDRSVGVVTCLEALPVTHTYAHKRKLREEHLPPTGSCLLQHSCCECLLSANMEQVQSGGGCYRSRIQKQKQGKANLWGIRRKRCVIKGQLVQENALWCFRSAWHLRSQLLYGAGSRSNCFSQALFSMAAACKARHSASPTCFERSACQDKGIPSPTASVQSVLGRHRHILTERARIHSHSCSPSIQDHKCKRAMLLSYYCSASPALFFFFFF